MSRIAIAGAGAFGTALAVVAASAGHAVTLWTRSADMAQRMATERMNARYLPDVTLPAAVTPTAELPALAAADVVLLATPAQSTRAMLGQIAPHVPATTPLVLCAKGLEQDTGMRLDEMLQGWRPDQAFALLSGPGFAAEIAAGKPAAVAIASPDAALCARLCALLQTPTFRPYAQDDVAGVALAGALKNVFAIGAGAIAGAALGEGAKAAYITRALAETVRLGTACGATPAAFMGLAGLGDMVLTCSSAQSRNYAYGYALAQNVPPPGATVEGLPTLAAARALARRHGVDAPLTEALHALCYEGRTVNAVLADLLARPLKAE